MRSFLTAALNPCCIGLPYGPKFIDPPPKWPDSGENSVSVCLTFDSVITAGSQACYHYVFYPVVPCPWWNWSADLHPILHYADTPYENITAATDWYPYQYFACRENDMLDFVLAYPRRIVGFGMRITCMRPTHTRLDSTSTPPFRYEVLTEPFNHPTTNSCGILPTGNPEVYLFDWNYLWTYCKFNTWPEATSGWSGQYNDSLYVRYQPKQDDAVAQMQDVANLDSRVPMGDYDHHWKLPIVHTYRKCTNWAPWCDSWYVELALHLEVMCNASATCAPFYLVPPRYTYGQLCSFLNTYDPIVRHRCDLYPAHDLLHGQRAIL